VGRAVRHKREVDAQSVISVLNLLQDTRLFLRTNASDATYSVAGNRIASFGPARAEAQ
jgi:hypothetical protein